MSAWDLQQKLEDLIDLLLDTHPKGFQVLLGEEAPPVQREIHDMMQARRARDERADTRNAARNLTTDAERIIWDAEAFQTVIKDAYGWPHIVEVSNGYRDANPKLWAVVVDHVRYVGNSVSRVGSQLGYVAIRHGLAPDTVTRYRREFPARLALAILCPPADGRDFRLMPG
jgi:hypothetical protein